MQRIVVVGSAGAGKTTLAKQLAAQSRVPHIELDALHWGPDWTSSTPEEMRRRVREAINGTSWTLDGNYLKLCGDVWMCADTIIWLDYSFFVVFGRILRRSVRRAIWREVLWNGNRESWKLMFSRDSILLWVISTYRQRRREVLEALAQPEFSHLRVVHLGSPRQTRNWLRANGYCWRREDIMSLKDELKEYYTVGELAALLRVTDAAIEKWTQCGEVAHEVVEAAIRIPRGEVEKLLGKRRRVKMRRAGVAGVAILTAIAGAGVAWQKRRK